MIVPSVHSMATAFIVRAEHLREMEDANRRRRSLVLADECGKHATRCERQADLLIALIQPDGAKSDTTSA